MLGPAVDSRQYMYEYGGHMGKGTSDMVMEPGLWRLENAERKGCGADAAFAGRTLKVGILCKAFQ